MGIASPFYFSSKWKGLYFLFSSRQSSMGLLMVYDYRRPHNDIPRNTKRDPSALPPIIIVNKIGIKKVTDSAANSLIERKSNSSVLLMLFRHVYIHKPYCYVINILLVQLKYEVLLDFTINCWDQ